MHKKESDKSLVSLAGEESGVYRAALFPGKYIQGPGVVSLTGKIAADLGEKALVLGGKTALSASWEQIKISLDENRINYDIFKFSGESTAGEIEAVTKRAGEVEADLIIGVGGGKAIDTAKAAACKSNSKVLIIPTVASTDAPTSAISVVYDQDGHFLKYYRSSRNPDAVLVDSKVLSVAPTRYLCAGMGGALAVSYEAEAAYRAGALNMAGGLPFSAVTRWAIMGRELIFEQARMARLAADQNLVTPALEAVIEANLLLSGIGFESGGLAAAHGVYHGFRSAIPALKGLHGEIVAYGTLVQLVLERRNESELRALITLYKELGLPVCLEQAGLPGLGAAALKEAADYACEAGTTKNMPFTVDSAMMLEAILFVDILGRD